MLAESRLKGKDGTHNTSVRIRCSEILTVPMWVTFANYLLGSLTCVDMVAMIVVYKDTKMIIWSVTPMPIIHVLSVDTWETLVRKDSWHEEKTKWDRFKLIDTS